MLIDEWSEHWSKSKPDDTARKWQYAHTEVGLLERFLNGVRVRATYEPCRFYSVWKIPRLPSGNKPIPDQVSFGLRREQMRLYHQNVSALSWNVSTGVSGFLPKCADSEADVFRIWEGGSKCRRMRSW